MTRRRRLAEEKEEVEVEEREAEGGRRSRSKGRERNSFLGFPLSLGLAVSSFQLWALPIEPISCQLPLPVFIHASSSLSSDKSAYEKPRTSCDKKKKENAPSPGNKLAVKALPPSSEELDENEREAAVVVVGAAAIVLSIVDASNDASGALEAATEAVLFRLPKSAFILRLVRRSWKERYRK